MKGPGKFDSLDNKKGNVIVLVAVALIAILGLVGLALDLGYIYGVKGQLQTAADASALAGARALYPANSSLPLSAFPPPDFSTAQASANTFATESKVADVKLTSANIVSIETGYWTLGQTAEKTHTVAAAGKCSVSGANCNSGADCPVTEACMFGDLPAVQVTVRKSVPTFFAKILGWDELSREATATAVVGYPQSGKGVFPLAVTKCMVDNYFAQDPIPSPPAQIVISGPYGPVGSSCTTGQWTSLASGKNDVDTIREMMYGDPPAPAVSIGDGIQIQPGAKDALYHNIKKDFIGEVVELPVVADAALATNSITPVMGFVYFRIESVNAADKQFTGHFLAYYKNPNPNSSTPGGPQYNAVTPPILVR